MDARLYPKHTEANTAAAEGAAERHLFTVEFVSKDGTRTALPFALLLLLTYSAEDGLTADFGHAKVVVVGTGLQPVYEGLLRRTLERVEEISGSAAAASDDRPVVERITIELAGR